MRELRTTISIAAGPGPADAQSALVRGSPKRQTQREIPTPTITDTSKHKQGQRLIPEVLCGGGKQEYVKRREDPQFRATTPVYQHQCSLHAHRE